MKYINVHCPKCQQSVEVEAPRPGLSFPMAAIVLVVGVVIGFAGFASMPRHAPARTAWIPPGKTQELVDTLPTVNLQELSQGTALRSKSGNTRSMVVFNNKTAGTVQYDWIDFNGQRKMYCTIAPHGSATQATFATHPWLIVDEKDNPIALFVSLPGHCIANINGHL